MKKISKYYFISLRERKNFGYRCWPGNVAQLKIENKKEIEFKINEIKILFFYYFFFQECPNGVVDEQSFKEIFVQFFPQGGTFLILGAKFELELIFSPQRSCQYLLIHPGSGRIYSFSSFFSRRLRNTIDAMIGRKFLLFHSSFSKFIILFFSPAQKILGSFPRKVYLR